MFTLKQLESNFSIIKICGNPNTSINKLVELKTYNGNTNELTWCNDKNIEIARQLNKGTIICSSLILESKLNINVNYIITEHPRKLFQALLMTYFYSKPTLGIISKMVDIHSSVKLGKNCSIGNFTTIEADCEIGENVFIGNNNVILKGTIIKDHVYIGNNNTIGGIGFGYEKDSELKFQLVPHIGNVIIKSYVDIGNNTCIDRSVLGSTIIGENCKIDNLVHIAHNVELGNNNVIIANSIIGGSVKTGDNVWISPSASIMNGIDIGENCIVGLGAVVLKTVEKNSVVVGNPSRKIKDIKF